MKITSVRTTSVRLPIAPPPYPTEGAGTSIGWGRRSRLSPKRPTPMLEYLLTRIETDEGVTGIGESTVDIGFFGQTLEEVRAAIDDYLGPQLIGKDPRDREYLLWVIDYRANSLANESKLPAKSPLPTRYAVCPSMRSHSRRCGTQSEMRAAASSRAPAPNARPKVGSRLTCQMV